MQKIKCKTISGRGVVIGGLNGVTVPSSDDWQELEVTEYQAGLIKGDCRVLVDGSKHADSVYKSSTEVGELEAERAEKVRQIDAMNAERAKKLVAEKAKAAPAPRKHVRTATERTSVRAESKSPPASSSSSDDETPVETPKKRRGRPRKSKA